MTTVHLPDALADQLAALVGDQLGAVDAYVEQAVREALARRRARDLERPVAVVSPCGRGGALPDVDLSRWALFLQDQAARPREPHLGAPRLVTQQVG